MPYILDDFSGLGSGFDNDDDYYFKIINTTIAPSIEEVKQAYVPIGLSIFLVSFIFACLFCLYVSNKVTHGNPEDLGCDCCCICVGCYQSCLYNFDSREPQAPNQEPYCRRIFCRNSRHFNECWSLHKCCFFKKKTHPNKKSHPYQNKIKRLKIQNSI